MWTSYERDRFYAQDVSDVPTCTYNLLQFHTHLHKRSDIDKIKIYLPTYNILFLSA